MKRDRSVFLVLFVWALALAPGCPSESFEPDVCPPSACTHGSCSAPVECAHDRDCPLGLSCSVGSCRVKPFARVDRDALISGFNVAEFELQSTSEEPVTFGWRAPEDAQRVVCALFTAVPEFTKAQEESEHSLFRMLNEGRAVARKRSYNTASVGSERHFSFKLADLEASSSCGAPLTIPTEFVGPYTVVQLLRVGCWAFSDARVIAATRLAPLDPRSLPDWDTVPQVSCLGVADRTWCRPPGTPGSCQGGICNTMRLPPPASPDVLGAAGEAADTLAPVVDCESEPDDAPCVIQSTQVGQCLTGQCLAQEAQDYEPPLVVSNCGAPRTQGLNCYPSAILDFGNCYQGRCEPRCDQRAECESAFEVAGVVNAGKHVCRIERDAYLGSCQPESR